MPLTWMLKVKTKVTFSWFHLLFWRDTTSEGTWRVAIERGRVISRGQGYNILRISRVIDFEISLPYLGTRNERSDLSMLLRNDGFLIRSLVTWKEHLSTLPVDSMMKLIWSRIPMFGWTQPKLVIRGFKNRELGSTGVRVVVIGGPQLFRQSWRG